MKYYIYYLLFFLLVTSCQKKVSNELIEVDGVDTYFTDNDFANVINVESKLLNDRIVHNPVRLALQDSVLFAVDTSYSTDTIVRVFSVNNGKYCGALFAKGNGPKEVLAVDNITFSNNSFWTYDITSQKWIGNDFIDIFNGKQNEEKQVIDFKKMSYIGVHDPHWIKDGFVANNLFKFKERFSIYASDGIIKKDVFNPKFHINEALAPSILGDIFSTNLTVTPNRNRIILAGRYLDVIEVYDTNGKLLKLLKGPKKDFDFKFDEQRSIQNSALIKSPESCRAYLKIRATEDRIYALFSGKNKKDKEHYSYSKIIYVLSMEGMPLTKYQLDVPVIDFVVDEDRNKIFAVAGTPESEIVSFDI